MLLYNISPTKANKHLPLHLDIFLYIYQYVICIDSIQSLVRSIPTYRTSHSLIYTHRLSQTLCVAIALLMTMIYSSNLYAFEDDQEGIADIESEEMLDESFILLRIRDKGDSFYRVMMDEYETPYLNILDIFNKWLEMKAECDIDRLFCQAQYPSLSKIHWIDGRQMQHSVIDSEASATLNKSRFFKKEGELWLRYDAWNDWAPVTITWTVDKYYLSIVPKFKSLKQLVEERHKQREQSILKRKKELAMEAKPPIIPDKPNLFEARYSIVGTRPSNEDSSLSFAYDVSAGLGRYNFKASGSPDLIQLTGSDDDEVEEGEEAEAPRQNKASSVIDFWNITAAPKPSLHLLELGHTSFPSSLLSPSIRSSAALHIEKRERSTGSGQFEYHGNTEPGAEVELYINGNFEEAQFTDGSGHFEFPRRFINGGDRIVLKYYLTDGSIDEEVFEIAAEVNPILAVGEWDARLFSGEANSAFAHAKGVSRFEYRYGIMEGFSPAVHLLQLPMPDEDDPFLFLGSDFSLRPLNAVVFNTELLFHNVEEASVDYATQLDFLPPGSHAFQWFRMRVDPNSPLVLTDGFSIQQLDIDRFIHSFQFSRWLFFHEYSHEPDQSNLISKINRRFNRDLNMTIELDYNTSDLNGSQLASMLGFTYSVSHEHLVNLQRNHNDTAPFTSIRYRYIRSQDQEGGFIDHIIPNRASLQGSVEDGGTNTLGLNLAWNVTPELTTNLTANKTAVTLQIRWQQGWRSTSSSAWAPERPWVRKPYSDFRLGTVSGYVLSPKDENGEQFPLPGITMRADVKRAVTDDEGFFEINGLTYNTPLEIKLDPSTLDASMIPKSKIDNIQFWPTSNIDYNPLLNWTAGVDGHVDLSGTPLDEAAAPFGNMVVTITDVETGETIITVPVEEDGYYMAEGLYPGEFKAALNNSEENQAFKPTLFTIPPGSDWVSDVVIDAHSE